MNYNLIAILAGVSSYIANKTISKELSLHGFVVWYGLSFIIIWIIFILVSFIIK